MSCRVAMLRMHRDGLIPLPAPRRRHYNGTLHRRRTPQAEPELPIIARVDALPALQLRHARARSARSAIVARVRGPLPLPRLYARLLGMHRCATWSPASGNSAGGRQALAPAPAKAGSARPLASGWSVDPHLREARLQLVVNNARLLDLAHVGAVLSTISASTVLARSVSAACFDRRTGRLAYGYRPLLLETFVQSDRFAGMRSYRAPSASRSRRSAAPIVSIGEPRIWAIRVARRASGAAPDPQLVVDADRKDAHHGDLGCGVPVLDAAARESAISARDMRTGRQPGNSSGGRRRAPARARRFGGGAVFSHGAPSAGSRPRRGTPARPAPAPRWRPP